MKDDYLWNKTGNDSEIEKLENTLRIFRFEESEPPQIQATVLDFKQKSPRKVFPVFRLLAASLIIAFFSAGSWFVLTNIENESANRQIEDFPVQNVKNENPEIYVLPTDEQNEKEIFKTNFKKQKIESQKTVYKPKIKTKKINNKELVIKLTQEEKEAYEKLMLALSITSSKLKIVKDKVLNLDGQTAINTENNVDTREK